MVAESSLHLVTPIGDAGRKHLQTSIENAGLTLTKLLLGTGLLDTGSVSAILPSGNDGSGMEDYWRGGVASLGRSETVIKREIVSQVVSNGEGVVVAESAALRCSDPIIQSRKRVPRFCLGDEVYYWARLSGGPDAVDDAMRYAASAWISNGLVSSLPGDSPAPGSSVDLELIRYLAANVTMVYTSAFDSESFVLWIREPAAT